MVCKQNKVAKFPRHATVSRTFHFHLKRVISKLNLFDRRETVIRTGTKRK